MSEAAGRTAHQVAKEMKKRMEDSHRWLGSFDKRTIYKLPPYITAANNSYNPQVVSFGPYHHRASHLKQMEKHKWRALRHLIDRASRDSTRSVDLEALVSGVSEVVQELKDCYDSLYSVWDDDLDSDESFAKLMILDGCFMLEVLRAWRGGGVTDYELNDPIFSNHGKQHIFPIIRRDMLLLENQLPMLLLDTLISVETGQNKEMIHQSTIHLVMEFINEKMHQTPGTCLHALDAYRKCIIQGPPSRRQCHEIGYGDPNSISFPTATEIHESGLKIIHASGIRDISFDRGVLRVLGIKIDDMTESMLLNLAAFERLHVGAGNDIASYILFMGTLIHSERDVALLRSKGLVHNILGSDEEAAMLFRSLSRDLTTDSNKGYLTEVLQAVNCYRTNPHHAWRACIADLKNTYFRSRWAGISVVAAISLFALTFTQTYYTVFPNKCD